MLIGTFAAVFSPFSNPHARTTAKMTKARALYLGREVPSGHEVSTLQLCGLRLCSVSGGRGGGLGQGWMCVEIGRVDGVDGAGGCFAASAGGERMGGLGKVECVLNWVTRVGWVEE